MQYRGQDARELVVLFVSESAGVVVMPAPPGLPVGHYSTGWISAHNEGCWEPLADDQRISLKNGDG